MHNAQIVMTEGGIAEGLNHAIEQILRAGVDERLWAHPASGRHANND
jgi:hypothetical protein